MVRFNNWRIFMGFAAFMLLATGTLNDFPASAQANFVNPTSPATAQASLPNQAGEIAGTTWQGQKGIVQTTRQIMDRKKNNLKPARPRPILPVRSRSASTGQPATTEGAAQAGLSSTSSETKAAANPLQAAFLPTVDNTFPGYPITSEDITKLPYQVIPPDTMGAVGPTQFVMAINAVLRTFDKTTGIPDGALEINPYDFFSAVMSDSVNNYTNFPRVRYDRYSSRWILLVNDVPGGETKLPNRILLAVSDGPIISQATNWTEYYFEPGALLPGNIQNLFADYPTLGIDTNAIYIGVNLYTTNNFAFLNSAAFVVKKSSILNGGPISVTTFPSLIDSSGNGPFTPQGVDNLDSSVAEGYFIGVNLNYNDATNTQLQLRRVTDPGGTPTLSSENIPVTITPTALPIPVPHKGNTGDMPPDSPDKGKLNPVDDRLINAVIRNGSLWTAHTIGINSSGISSVPKQERDRDGSRWYEIALPTSQSSNPTVKQSGTLYDNSLSKKSYWLPSITVSGQGHVVMGLNVAGPTDYISAAITGRLKSDNLNSMQAPVNFITSTVAYNPSNDPGNIMNGRRWGDYSYTSLDPEDDMTFWTIQEFAYNNDNYGIQIAKLKAPPPATPVSVSPSYLIPGQSNIDITITGNMVNGSGFFDPGPGFPMRFKISIDGEILVNNITSVSPTSIALNVSTVFATTGTHSVTVTNPDGQSITVAGIITVNNFSCPPQEVTNTNNTGSGSLRDAITQIQNGCKIIILNVSNPIMITSSLPALPQGVTITTNKPCSNGKVEIVRKNDNTFVGDGLILNGGTFFGINVHGFDGKQIVVNKGNNHMKCITVGRT